MDEPNASESPRRPGLRLTLTSLTALGVVFGDIGTSPLYAFRLCFSETTGIAPHPENILGVLSLVFWAITIVISVKYLLYILLADFNGEGGVLALMALGLGGRVPQQTGGVLVALGLGGAALLYGDGMITPAISVLSAIEGLAVAAPQFAHAVIPLSIMILIGIFAVQRHGTKRIGRFFGPIMLLWFIIIATLGVIWIAGQAEVLLAVDPRHGIRFLIENGWVGFMVLGFVFLVVTGGEALYADLGHFGLRPIRLGWFGVAMPAILLNYFGQAAFMLSHPDQVEHSFYSMAPNWFLYPLIGIATLAAIIASQAVISGAFSLTYQAIQLGFMPRLTVKHYAADG
ncbi:KUP/HAK/KT family potassium transporter, partial [Myxococcota bacterium]|nr:KUP/HAK/KT family potassium transporter [Myxococcota bacterium]